MDSHVHLSGLEFVVVGVMASIFIMVCNLLARRFPGSTLSQSWLYAMAPGAAQHNGQ